MKIQDSTKRLIKKACKSLCRFKIAALGLDRKGNPLCIQFNKPGLKKAGGGQHAEMLVLKKSPPNLHSIILLRVNRSGKLLPIDPCAKCAWILGSKGIKIRTIRPWRRNHALHTDIWSEQ